MCAITQTLHRLINRLAAYQLIVMAGEDGDLDDRCVYNGQLVRTAPRAV